MNSFNCQFPEHFSEEECIKRLKEHEFEISMKLTFATNLFAVSTIKYSQNAESAIQELNFAGCLWAEQDKEQYIGPRS